MPDEKSRTLGAALITLRSYLDDRHGAGAYDRLRIALAERHAVALAAHPGPRTWYPTATFLAALDLAGEQAGQADFHERYGRVAAEYDLQTLGRIIARIGSKEWVLHRAARLWQRYHSTGEWHIEYQPGLAQGTLRGFGAVHRGYCRVMAGWLQRAFEITGAQGVSASHPRCRAEGQDACTFLVAWRSERQPQTARRARPVRQAKR